MAASWQRGRNRSTLGGMTRMTVNGEPLDIRLDPDTPLLWALRDASNLTGTKYGCDSRDCGACTVPSTAARRSAAASRFATSRARR